MSLMIGILQILRVCTVSFAHAYNFNQPLDKWNVSNVKDMSFMFNEAKSFNQNLDNWDISNLENIWCMFFEAFDFSNGV